MGGKFIVLNIPVINFRELEFISGTFYSIMNKNTATIFHCKRNWVYLHQEAKFYSVCSIFKCLVLASITRWKALMNSPHDYFYQCGLVRNIIWFPSNLITSSPYDFTKGDKLNVQRQRASRWPYQLANQQASLPIISTKNWVTAPCKFSMKFKMLITQGIILRL